LLQELFNDTRCRIVRNIERVQLPKYYIEYLYDDTISMERGTMEQPFLSYLVEKISNQYRLAEIELIHYVQTKRNCNSNLHVDQEIKNFAIIHSVTKDNDVEKFMHEKNLFIKIDENERKKLQKVFEKVCRLYNKSRYILILLNEGPDSRYRSKISLSFFFVVIQHNDPHFNLIKNSRSL
jgi:hypothetical protein